MKSWTLVLMDQVIFSWSIEWTALPLGVIRQWWSSSIMIFSTQQAPQTIFYEQIIKYFALKWNAWQGLTVRKATFWLINWADKKVF
jgi:hypothetical protein